MSQQNHPQPLVTTVLKTVSRQVAPEKLLEEDQQGDMDLGLQSPSRSGVALGFSLEASASK